MTYWILKTNGQIITRSTVRPILPEEWSNEAEKTARTEFDDTIKDKYGLFNPDLLEVFDNEILASPSVTNKDEGDQSVEPNIDRTQITAQSAQHDVVRGPDLFQNAEIFYPHGDRNETT
jgi:hypothetical protein